MLIQSRLVVSEVSKSPYYKGESVCRGCDEYGWLAVHTPKERVALSYYYYYYNDYYYTTVRLLLLLLLLGVSCVAEPAHTAWPVLAIYSQW